MMNSLIIRPLLCALSGGLLALLMQGCITSKKYRLTDPAAVPAPAELNWTVSTPPQTLTLKNLIVFKGPGSWKQAARWDEYIVQWTNGGEQVVTIDSAVLTDLLNVPQVPGTNPWPLEKLSYTNWDRYGKLGLKVLAGAGALTIYTGAVVGTATVSLMGGAGAGAGLAFMVGVVPPLVALDITLVAVRNHHNKAAVETEFQRRRLVLPASIAPGTSITGSLFFPMTPGPQRLTLGGTTGGVPFELALDLKPLASLHLESPPKTPEQSK